MLLFKPGRVAKDYMAGKRNSHLDPVRMYIFTSALFFLVFFSVYDPESGFEENNLSYVQDSVNFTKIYKLTDSAEFAKQTSIINNGRPLSRQEFDIIYDSIQRINDTSAFFGLRYKNVQEYDSALQAGLDHGWLKRSLIYKSIELQKKYRNNSTLIWKALANNLFHKFPQLLFVSLPLYALILKLLYRRKHYFYTHHLVFSLYLYISLFIIMLGMLAASGLFKTTDVTLFRIIGWFLFSTLFLYEFIAIRNFYAQGYFKTFAKYVIIQLLRLVIFVILFIIFVFISFLTA